MDPSPTTVAVVLAAGGGSRFAGPGHKLAATIDGRSLAAIAVETAVRAGIGPVVVVAGDEPLPGVGAAAGEPDRIAVHVVRNPRWSEGQITSLRCGIDEARRLGADAVVVGLADQPFVTAEAWRSVAAASSPIAVATYDGERGNPVRLHASTWSLLPDRGDEGARALIRRRPDLVEPVPCPGSAVDIDTLEDLHRWQSKS